MPNGPEMCFSFYCSTTPLAVAGITDATALSAGGGFACVIVAGGAVECWGENDDGELGDGTKSGYSNVPVTVSGVE